MAKMTAAHFRREIDTLAAELALLGQQRILDELPECERSIIAMSREGLSRGGISRRLRMTDAGVEWRMRRTIRRLDPMSSESRRQWEVRAGGRSQGRGLRYGGAGRFLPKAPTRASAEEASHERREQNRRP